MARSGRAARLCEVPASDRREPQRAVHPADVREQLQHHAAPDRAVQEQLRSRARALIDATLRTNYFQRDDRGARKTYLSFKLDSHAVKDLPLPRPLFEIFVYAPS